MGIYELGKVKMTAFDWLGQPGRREERAALTKQLEADTYFVSNLHRSVYVSHIPKACLESPNSCIASRFEDVWS